MHHKLFSAALVASCAMASPALAGLEVTRAAAPPTGPAVRVQQTAQDNAGNTRFRYYPASLRGDPPVYSTAAGTWSDLTYDDLENAPGASYRYNLRDRDLGQTFTVGGSGYFLDAVTLRVGPTAQANEGAAGGAKVSMQLLRVTGTPTVNNNASPPKSTTQWRTFDPGNTLTDDYITGETYTPLATAAGGVLPGDIGANQYMRWDLTGTDQLWLEPGATYAFVVMFDEAAAGRGLALANGFFSSGYAGGHGIRRDGSSTARSEVFIHDLNDAADVAVARRSAMFPADRDARLAVSPGTLGYPDVDTYRDFVFFIEGADAIPEPAAGLAAFAAAGLLLRRRR